MKKDKKRRKLSKAVMRLSSILRSILGNTGKWRKMLNFGGFGKFPRGLGAAQLVRGKILMNILIIVKISFIIIGVSKRYLR